MKLIRGSTFACRISATTLSNSGKVGAILVATALSSCGQIRETINSFTPNNAKVVPTDPVASPTVAPVAPTIPALTSPSGGAVSSNSGTLRIAGNCLASSVVELTGDDTQTTGCASGGFEFTVTKTADGAYHFTVVQGDPATGLKSDPATIQWNLDTAVPSSVSIGSPAQNPLISSGSSIRLSGACEPLSSVTISSVPSGVSETLTCGLDGNFSYDTPSVVEDGVYGFSISQSDAAGNISPATSLTWIRDTSVPEMPQLGSPSSSVYHSASTTLRLSGSCVSGNTIVLGGDESATRNCEADAFAFEVTRIEDGTYDFTLTQINGAGTSSATTPVRWIRDTAVPTVPGISPSLTAPVISSAAFLEINGSCESGTLVSLSGDSTGSQVCAESAYAFTVVKAEDGDFRFAIRQTDLAGNSSDEVTIAWTRDTHAPSAPVIQNPGQSPYYSSGSLSLVGSCESGATVRMTGAENQSAICHESAFSFTIPGKADGTYNLALDQVDLAGNVSNSVAQVWVVDSQVPASPTIAQPATNPVATSGNELTISGQCMTGATVKLSGYGAAARTTSCSDQTFAFNVSKSADGTYGFTVSQISASGLESGGVTVTWNRDTTGPTTTLTSTPGASSVEGSGSFSFTVNESGSSTKCRVDSADFELCTSPAPFSDLTAGAHTFEAYSIDSLGNVGPTVSHAWAVQSYKTVALYHFDLNSDPGLDSGLYQESLHNNLVNSGTAEGSTLMSASRRFSSNKSQYMTATHNSTLAALNREMTFESYIKFRSIPGSDYMTVASKSGASGQRGWEIKVKKNGSKHHFAFVGSLDGVTQFTVRSREVDLSTSSFIHLAVTWSRGTVTFYLNGISSGGGEIGIAGTAELFANTSSLYLGRSNAGEYLDAELDEVRLSRVVRYNANFLPSLTPYTAD